MTIEDAAEKTLKFTGEFIAHAPMDGLDIAYCFTTIDEVPFFITQFEKQENKFVIKHSIAFTEAEFKHFISFMRLLLKPEDQSSRDTDNA